MKNNIDKLFAKLNEREVFEFCKQYATDNNDFALALKMAFKEKLDEQNPELLWDNYCKQIDKCFSNFAKKPVARWLNYEYGNLDWGAISVDLKGLVDNLSKENENGNHRLVVRVCLASLNRTATAYEEEGASDNNDFDMQHARIMETLDLLDDALEAGDFSKEELLSAADELDKIYNKEAFAILKADVVKVTANKIRDKAKIKS